MLVNAISVTDDARKLSDQLERATGERIAALDGVAKEAAFGLESSQDRVAGHAGRMDRGHQTELPPDREHGGEHRPWHELDWDLDPELAERDSVPEETLDLEEMSVDRDLGL